MVEQVLSMSKALGSITSVAKKSLGVIFDSFIAETVKLDHFTLDI